MTDRSKTFCILPFIHIQVKPNGQIKPCCRFDFVHDDYIDKEWNLHKDSAYHTFNRYNITNGTTLTEAMSSDLWNDIRKKMLLGDRVSGCRKCYAEESFNGSSMRTYENHSRNQNIQDRPIDSVEPFKIKYLEMTFGNYCNLKCRTCAGDLSSTWHDEEILLSNFYPGRYSAPKVLNIPFNWKPEDFVNVEEIKFTGGEPMIHPDFLKLMDMLIDIDIAKNVSINVYTNCSWKPGDKFLNRLTKFKQIKISLSVDGFGRTNDYIRTPSKWAIVDNVVDNWLILESKNPDKIRITWDPTINLYNILEIDKMLDWWDKKQNSIFPDRLWPNLDLRDYREDQDIPSFRFIFHVLHDPKYLCISNLPSSIKEIVRQKIKTIKEKYDCLSASGNPRKENFNKKLETIIGKLNSKPDDDMLEIFASYTADLDKLRNQSIKFALPILYDELKKYVNFEGKLQ